MPPEPARLALLLGPAGFSERVAALLPELSLRLAHDGAELREALAAEGASVGLVIVDADTLAAEAARGPLVPEPAPPARGSRPPLVALGCADADAVDRALAAGASLAVRADAREREVRSLVRACITERELSRDCEIAHQDLERHAALLDKDDLTAAYNRRYFDRSLGEALDRARRDGTPVSVIFMDIDDLKSVNLRHGHALGSLVLREAAARTMRSVRATDKVMRYGGDEFCILLPGVGATDALATAERIRTALAEAPFAVEAVGGVSLTASFGIAAHPEHGSDASTLVRAADRAMLRIKEQQKNGILMAAATP